MIFKQKNIRNIIFLFTITALIFMSYFIFIVQKREKVCAYVRVKDEIKTIEACLNSIDKVFDKIVIIHSNEPDDGSVKYMNKWCSKRRYCEIHEYPYKVIPAHSQQYTSGDYKKENTLASYNNFGLQFFEPEEWVVKIDGDQVYMTKALADYLMPFKKGEKSDHFKYGLIGFNTLVRNNELVKIKGKPLNGIKGDSFIIKRKYIKNFIQHTYYEDVNYAVPHYSFSPPVWFHFMKSLKSGGNIIKNEDCPIDKIEYLKQEEKDLFDAEIRPLLINSPYYNVKIPVSDK